MAEPEPNLRTLFSTANDLKNQLDSLQTASQQYQENLRAAISKFEESRELAARISLFSPNETEDDISSSDLQYMSIDYHLGDLIPKVVHHDRKVLLLGAQEAFTRFLNLLDAYDMLSQSDKKLYERYLESKSTFSLLSNSSAASRRETKIARFQQEQELKQKLEYLAANPSSLQNDDSTLRSLHHATLTLYTHQTFQGLDFIAQELKMISMAPPSASPSSSPPQDTRSRTNGFDSEYSERLDPFTRNRPNNTPSGPLLSPNGKPLQPFTLLDTRSTLRKGVFQPGHRLPTMTIDEYLEEEKRRGGIISGGGNTEGEERVVNEDNLDEADRETMKKREWDEFVENNPKGSGNTLNRG